MRHIGKYINPFTDFGFKYLFGSEPSKEMLIDLLNQILPAEDLIVTLEYYKNEQLGRSALERKSVIDIFCTNQNNDKFIIEVQRTQQEFFKDRTLYYATFPIQEQAKRNKWNYELKKVYVISFLDFLLKIASEDFLHYIQLKDQTNEVFYDKLTLIYIEARKFDKDIDELETDFEKWMFILRNIERLERIPEKLKSKIMNKFFELAEVVNLASEERAAYGASLKAYRDNTNAEEYSQKMGFEKAEKIYLIKVEEERRQKEEERRQKEEERRQKEEALRRQEVLMKRLYQSGVSMDEIANMLGISTANVRKIVD